MSYPRYPEYKDSGVVWLGEVPAHWEMKRLGYFANLSGGGTPDRENPDYWNGDIPWITPKDMKVEYLEESEDKVTELGVKESSASIINANHVLVVMRSGILKHTIPVGINVVPTTVNQDIKAIDVSKELNPSFFMRFIQGFNQELLSEWRKQGATVESLETDLMNRTWIPVPPKTEQQSIIDFIDRESRKTDVLVSEQERLIELLREKRQAVISHAVTKGLDPTLPMKDSGIEGLGEVPKHWKITRLGFESWVRARLGWKGLKAEEYVDDGYILLATPNIKGYQIDFENVNFINKDRYEESPEIKINQGDILLAKDGSTLGTVNVVRTLPRPATVNSSIAVISPSEHLNSLYLYYFFQSCYMEYVIHSIKGGMGVPHLFQKDLVKFYLLLPNLDEQLAIVNFLEDQIKQIDALILETQRTIELLKERRAALISAAVTGKIDVRGIMAKEGREEVTA